MWRPMVVKSQRGVCLYNFNIPPCIDENTSLWRLSLVLGDLVVILHETDTWYYGHTVSNPALRGIFPKSFIHLKTDELELEEPLIEEMNCSLREWYGMLQADFLTDDEVNMKIINAIMTEVMTMRANLIAGKMTREESREMRKKITTKLDFLNHQLQLDLVVRDPVSGNVLDPTKTSAVQLYRSHVKSSEKIKTLVAQKPKDDSETSNTFKIMLTVKNFVSNKVNEDVVDLNLSIYELNQDGKTPKPLCESYVVPNFSTNSKSENNLRVLFGDISKNDIANKKLYLICNVVSNGNFCGKNTSLNNSSGDTSVACFRKPVGVAASDISDLFTFKQGKTRQNTTETELTCAFLPVSNESESWEVPFRKLMFDKKGSEAKSLSVSIGIIFGGGDNTSSTSSMCDMLNANVAFGKRIAVARKIGLPDIILPSDVRNDLYVCLSHGEFSKLDKRQDRNVEVTMEVCDELGSVVPNCISGGVGCELASSYHSLVYYHEGKPRWNEIVRVTLEAEQFAGCHIRFTYRHRSRNDSSNKLNLPWAMSFLKLVSDHEGTAVKDKQHDLIVYKIERKVEVENTSFYLGMPHLKSSHFGPKQGKNNNTGLTPVNKDVLAVQTTLASTKLTQNEGLFSLLKWKSEEGRLGKNLQIFNQKVTGEEFAKFIPDVLDALFSILIRNDDAEGVYDYKVFKSLIHVIQLITEDKEGRYTQFIPVLELYINENFYATLAYNKLLLVLKECVDNAVTKPADLVQAMKSLKYVFKFVVRSRQLCNALNHGKGQEPFEELLKNVLMSLVKLMFCTTQDLFKGQSYCLRHMVSAVPDLVTVFDAKQLAEILVQMITSLPKGHLNEHKIATIKELVHCVLFEMPECRAVMLPQLAAKIKELMYEGSENLTVVCTETLGDILKALHDKDKLQVGPDDIKTVMLTCLRTVVQSVANRRSEDRNVMAVVANLIGLLGQMTASHYEAYIGHFNNTSSGGDAAGKSDLLDFVMEVLGMFKDLVHNEVFPRDWNSMILLQNAVVLKSLCQFAHTIRDYFSSPAFEYQAWHTFFKCAITFITQPSLQLEKFSQDKRMKVTEKYGDMRKTMGLEVRQMWFNLGQHKVAFVPELVGNFLEMTLVPETELRKATIPIFFDMIQCEYFSPVYKSDSTAGNGNARVDKCNFRDFENELITKLDFFVAEAGSGDEHYLYSFKQIMLSYCENHTSIRESGTRYVKMASRLIDLLLEYRTVSHQNESKEIQMSCIVNLLNFYQEIGREELYVKYIKKLATLHEQCHNWAEAGFTIMQYAKLLRWTADPLLYVWKRHESCKTHKSLKEELYRDIIGNFEKGKMWEDALDVCKELVIHYETETFDYNKLATLLELMSTFYKNIMNGVRPEPEYFIVAFYGRGFPAFLQNKTFVYRGKSFEKRPDFQARILDQFPNAELMTVLKTPSEEEKSQPVQWLQINKVDPIMEEKAGFKNKPIHQEVLNYYKVNQVCKFMYSRPHHKGEKDKDNEFASLWLERTVVTTRETFPGILQWFPLCKPPEIYELTPIQNAIETMQRTNEDLRVLILQHQNQDPPLNPLSMKLNGIIDAAVMGGTAKYEKAFLNDKYVSEHPEDADRIETLQDLIAEQIPLLSVGIKIHLLKKPPDLKPFHDRLETMFQTIKATVESKYGKRTCDIKVRRVSHMDLNSKKSHHLDRSRVNTVNSLDVSSDQTEFRLSYNSQTSVNSDSTPLSKSRMFSSVMGGITRRRSNANSKEDNNKLFSNNHNNNHHRFNSSSSAGNLLDANNGSNNDLHPDSRSKTVIVTQEARLSSVGSSRPSSGQFQFLNNATSTPNHSRSPSINSNRDSVVSSEGLLMTMDTQVQQQPPPVPPKFRGDGSGDSLSLSNYGGESTNSEDVATKPPFVHHPGKKEAPPPPPPILINSGGNQTPPTPPKKPPFKPPID